MFKKGAFESSTSKINLILETEDIIWKRIVGADEGIETYFNGKDEVRTLWYFLANRSFSFHTWSNFVVTENDTHQQGIDVDVRYHGVILEGENGSKNYRDVFGLVTIHFNRDETDRIDNVFIHEVRTIDRGYGA